MIIGNGLIASAFSNFENDDYIIFASGVSFSLENRKEEFYREEKLLKSLFNTDKKIVYFSTVNLFDNNNPYFSHKKKMEKIICDNFKNYLIFRLPQVIGKGGNSNNLFNYFKNKIINDEFIYVEKNSTRSLIDIEDVRDICLFCFKYNNKILNISNINTIKVYDMVNIMYKYLNKISKIIQIDSLPNKIIENSYEIEECILLLNLKKENYTEKIIQKYI